MEMKEKYVPAEMEIIKFEAEDVIRTSGNPDDDYDLPEADM